MTPRSNKAFVKRMTGGTGILPDVVAHNKVSLNPKDMTMDNLKKELARVVVWIKSHGEESMDGKSYHFACKDEPYMHFTAEWQEWNDNKEVLYFGYHFEQNGDICYDPRFSFMIEGDQVTSISMMTANGKSYPVTTAGDLDYASQFLPMAY